MRQEPYKRQMSTPAAVVASIFLGLLLAVVSLPLGAAMLVFSPLILVITCGMTLQQFVVYPYRRRLVLEEPTGPFLGGWALAVPLAAVLAPAADLLARHAPGRLLDFGPDPKDVALSARLALLAALQVLLSVVLAARTYVRTPADAQFTGERPRKAPDLFVVLVGSTFFALTISMTGFLGSALLLDLLRQRAKDGVRIVPAVLGAVAAIPAVIVGLASLRRGLWMREVQRLVDDHPRSAVRAAATGLVELHGVARPLGASTPDAPVLLVQNPCTPGARTVVGDFLLDDGTGQVRVRLPEGTNPGRDGVVDLVRRSTPGGALPEFRLHAGDPVYVLGEYVPAAEGVGELRPWRAPQGRLLVPMIHELFRQDWSFWGLDYADALDLKVSADVFAVTDAGEERLRGLTRRRWAWSLALGFVLLGGAGAYVVRLLS